MARHDDAIALTLTHDLYFGNMRWNEACRHKRSACML